jgi:tetratricopeptide (TPR) repeat protein
VRAAALFSLVLVAADLAAGGRAAQAPEVEAPTQFAKALERLRSAEPFDREHSEAELRRLDDRALVGLAEHLHDPDRLFRFRLERIFSELLDRLVDDLDKEYLALSGDRRELEELDERASGERARTELEEIRLKELEERIADRTPALERLVRRVQALGLRGLTGILSRPPSPHERLERFHEDLVGSGIETLRSVLVEESGESHEAERYGRGLLWAWEVDHKGPEAAAAKSLLERHLEATLADLRDPETIIAERAADELYLLGRRGRESLDAYLLSAAAEGAARERFLARLLEWRVRPRTYARIGIDFASYRELSFRERRQKVFDYARLAREEAVPTLRAIVEEEALEPSFFVKLAAAKALAGLRDLWGYNVLLAKHPDMTVKKPEVSRELAIIRAYELIRERSYRDAVDELRRVLDEDPFNFRANYHIAFAYLLLKDYAKAIHHFEVARRREPADELTLYNLACAYALHGGRTKEALAALAASVASGFDDPEHIEKDPDLDSLRNEPEYRDLIERMKQGR